MFQSSARPEARRLQRMLLGNNGSASRIPGETLNWNASSRASPPGFSITTGTGKTYYDENAVMQTAGANTFRIEKSPHTGLWALKNEAFARTNSCLQNRNLSDAAWTKTAGIAQNRPGRDGVANKAWTVTDSSAAAFENVTPTATYAVPLDTQTYALAVWLEKTSGGTSATVGVNAGLSGGTVVANNLRINTDTGQFLGTAPTGGQITSEGNFWKVQWYHTNNGTNNVLAFALFPAVSAHNTFGDTVTQTGSCVVDGFHVEVGVGIGSFIETGALAVTLDADQITAPSAGLLRDSSGFVFADFTTQEQKTLGQGLVLGTHDGTVSTPLQLYWFGGTWYYYGPGNQSYWGGGLIPSPGVRFKAGVSWSGGTLVPAQNGIEYAPALVGAPSPVMGTSVSLGKPYGTISSTDICQDIHALRFGLGSLNGAALSALR